MILNEAMTMKKQVYVLGATGMLGHRMCCELAESFDVIGIVRRNLPGLDLFKSRYNFEIVVAKSPLQALEERLPDSGPAAVLNCVGAIKQLKEMDHSQMVHLNAVFPHQVSELCRKNNTQFIHYSTDCVFTGQKGDYTEADICDASDVYGVSKRLGELFSHGLTLRTSIVGRELRNHRSLVDWALSQPLNASLNGFSNAVYSGFPTKALAN